MDRMSQRTNEWNGRRGFMVLNRMRLNWLGIAPLLQ